jgi:hypothetical protein
MKKVFSTVFSTSRAGDQPASAVPAARAAGIGGGGLSLLTLAVTFILLVTGQR